MLTLQGALDHASKQAQEADSLRTRLNETITDCNKLVTEFQQAASASLKCMDAFQVSTHGLQEIMSEKKKKRKYKQQLHEALNEISELKSAMQSNNGLQAEVQALQEEKSRVKKLVRKAQSILDDV